MMKKRIVSLGLAAMMTAGLFAGCGNSSESQGDSTASGSKSDDIVTLKWVTIGSGMPDNYDSWVKKVNDYVGEKIGVNIDMEVVAWGDWITVEISLSVPMKIMTLFSATEMFIHLIQNSELIMTLQI